MKSITYVQNRMIFATKYNREWGFTIKLLMDRNIKVDMTYGVFYAIYPEWDN